MKLCRECCVLHVKNQYESECDLIKCPCQIVGVDICQALMAENRRSVRAKVAFKDTFTMVLSAFSSSSRCDEVARARLETEASSPEKVFQQHARLFPEWLPETKI